MAVAVQPRPAAEVVASMGMAPKARPAEPAVQAAVAMAAQLPPEATLEVLARVAVAEISPGAAALEVMAGLAAPAVAAAGRPAGRISAAPVLALVMADKEEAGSVERAAEVVAR